MSFWEAWPLFADAWMSSWIAAALLGLLGVAVVAREQVFLGAAMAQAATAATALAITAGAGALWIAALHLHGPLAVIAATLVALVTGLGRGHRESLVALVFLAASATALLLVARLPHGLQEVQRLTSSSVIGAEWGDTFFLGLLLAGTVAVAVARWRGLVTWLLDPAFAAAIGLPTARWAVLLALLLGLGVGWSLHVAGMLFALGCLVLPALAARSLVRELGTAAVVAPVIALAGAVTGSLAAHAYDLPPAQTTVGLLAAVAALSMAARRLRG
jgi:zinc/manganese transport system permease protein